MPAGATDHVNRSGRLDVGDGHSLYWEDWGNPDAELVVVHLHGGPGAGFSDSHKSLYDPARHRVVFHDQRGCGRSTPFAATEHNTSRHLVADVEALRRHLGLGRVVVAGGSWGSTLALLYAIAHPDAVRALLLWSIYLATQFESDWVNEGYPRHHLPAEWERFIGHVPAEHRGSGTSVMRFYADQLRSPDPARRQLFAREWTLWESALLSVQYDPTTLEAEIADDPATLSIAILETHYFLAGCFVPEGHILDNLPTITHIPAIAVHGRFDLCTPASSAHHLATAYGPRLDLRWANSGHLRTDPEMHAALRKAAAELLDQHP
ncbi:prolyl aminopeptidase [Pseudonocardia sp. CA-107938]|uniref:prolyl aminopeptidase n=1 Tax=Pseudonocardia sp. CA-107938 TaxID=3240021 RepID=UPI003D8B3DFC